MSRDSDPPRLRLVTPRGDATPPHTVEAPADDAAPAAPLHLVRARNVVPLRPASPPTDDPPRGAA